MYVIAFIILIMILLAFVSGMFALVASFKLQTNMFNISREILELKQQINELRNERS